MSCSKCGGTGLIIEGNKFKGFCDCEIGKELFNNRLIQKLGEIGVYKEYRTKELKDLIEQIMYKEHSKFVREIKNICNNIKSTKGTIIIYGTDSGTGKTLAGSLILKYALRSGISGKYISMSDFFHFYFNNDNESISEIKSVDVLVIDNLTADIKSGTINKNLLELTHYRGSNDKLTIIISNLNKANIEEYYPSLNSGIFIFVRGEDFRRTK